MRAELVLDALKNAAATTRTEPRAIFHSDGVNVYTSGDYRTVIKHLGMCSSMGRNRCLLDSRAGRIILLRADSTAPSTPRRSKAGAMSSPTSRHSSRPADVTQRSITSARPTSTTVTNSQHWQRKKIRQTAVRNSRSGHNKSLARKTKQTLSFLGQTRQGHAVDF